MPRLLLVVLALLAFPAAAWAEDPWEVDPYDTEGPYIIQGTGPPNARIELLRDGATFYLPNSGDSTLNEGEYTSPTGFFRIDEGFCNPSADCHGGDSDQLYRIVFHRLDQNRVPMWGGSSYWSDAAQAFDLPEVEDVPRSSRQVLSHTGGTSLPAWTTITGAVTIAENGGTAPLPATSVTAISPAGRSYSSSNAGGTNSLQNGTYTLKIPPGPWALRFRTPYGKPFYPGYVWHGCVVQPEPILPPDGTPPPTGAAVVSGGATGVDLHVGGTQASPTCNGTTVAPPDDEQPPPVTVAPGPGPAVTTPGAGPAPVLPPRVPAPPAPLAVAAAKGAANGTVTLTVGVPGPGRLTATVRSAGGKARAAAAKALATGSATATKAGPVKLVLKPSAATKRLLRKGRKVQGRATVTFRPASGPARTTQRTVTFALKRR